MALGPSPSPLVTSYFDDTVESFLAKCETRPSTTVGIDDWNRKF